MRVVFSNFALAELDQILAYITPRSRVGAERVHAEIMRTIHRISDNPYSAQELTRAPGARRVPLVRFPYLIYYEVENEVITILRILHGARRQPWI